MINGLLDLSGWWLLGVTLLMTHITIVAVTVFLHRCQAHRALELHPAVSHVLRFWLWLTTGMVTREWVAVHRKHHARCETSEDPHSPQVLGIHRVLWGGTLLYRRAVMDSQLLQRYGHGTPDDWLERTLYSRYPSSGILVMLLLNLLLFGLPGLLVWGVQMVWIPFWAAGVINGVGHYCGYRNYETGDASRNILPWGIVIGGEELHNNHHAFASSARLSSKRWELDIGWCYIRILQALGLARVKKLAPIPRHIPGKQVMDLDTMRAVVLNRFYVMADFGRRVVLPVLREELKGVDGPRRSFFRGARRFLLREESWLGPRERERLQRVLELSRRLRTVHEYHRQLQAIWSRGTVSNDKLLGALQEWCGRAETSGIRYLEDFAAYLKSYSLTHL